MNKEPIIDKEFINWLKQRSPFLTIFFLPRYTVEQRLHNNNGDLEKFISFSAGFTACLFFVLATGSFYKLPIWITILFVTTSGIFGGKIAITITALLWDFLGAMLFNSLSVIRDIKAALTWVMVPMICSNVIAIVSIICFSDFLESYRFFAFVLWVWSLTIMTPCVGVALHISNKQAVVVNVIGISIILVIAFICYILITGEMPPSLWKMLRWT